MSDLKLIDWGEKSTVIPVQDGVDPIIGKPSNRMFGVECGGERILFYLPAED